MMPEFRLCRRINTAELRPYVLGENLDGVSISQADKLMGSPKDGDYIARNPKDHNDRWLVSARYFVENYEFV